MKKKLLALIAIPFLFACDNSKTLRDPKEPSIDNFILAIDNAIRERSDLRACVKISGEDGLRIVDDVTIDGFDLVIYKPDLDSDMVNKLQKVGFLTELQTTKHPYRSALEYYLSNFTQKAYDESELYKKEDLWLGRHVLRYTLCTGSPKVEKIIQAENGSSRVKVLAKIKAEGAKEWIKYVKPEELEKVLQFELVLMHDGWIEESQIKLR